ncbi:MAG: hypothetical protein SFU53_03025 [Terrimicrobiaceae bacterium]|nr:hypothetical protein [Terrimicrobiaceae bacterium]
MDAPEARTAPPPLPPADGFAARLTGIFLIAFFADGWLSIVDEFVRNSWPVLTLARAAVALGTLGLGFLVFVALHVTPRLSKRVLYGPAVFVIWCGVFGAFPIAEFFPPETAGAILAALQAGWGSGLMAACGSFRAGRWSWHDLGSSRPVFTWRNLIVSVVLTGVLTVSYGALSVEGVFRIVARETAGYIRPGWDGLSLDERHFRRGDEEVRLVGMMHIANPSFYDSVVAGLPKDRTATVLLEGVSDRENLLRPPIRYDRVARLLGVADQHESRFTAEAAKALSEPDPQLEYRQADVDVSELDPRTIVYLSALGSLIQSPTIKDALRQIRDRSSPLHDDRLAQVAWKDILEKRNAHILGEIEAALRPGHTVVVPWGALHLPEIEAELEKRGFKESARKSRRALEF